MRPWPRPARPWTLTQFWCDLLFMHWPLPADALRPHLPPPLAPDLFDGQAWIGVIPFRMRGIRFRRLPPLPGMNACRELNVRTYVTRDGKPGVYFLSLDASNPLVVAGARAAFRLPYFRARMSLVDDGASVRYASRRTHRGARPAEFRAAYRPTGPVYEAQPGDLDYWLTERYCLYTLSRRGEPLRGEIDHVPWPLQPAAAECRTNTMAPLALPDAPPLLHFVREIEAVVWTPEPC